MPVIKANTRRWMRHKIDVPIRLIVSRSLKTRVVPGRGKELSEGGMALTAGVELKPGDEAAVEFTPPYTGMPIRIRGVIRNRQGYRYGIEFVTGNDEEKEQAERLRAMLSMMAVG
jgi:hypothetical protein